MESKTKKPKSKRFIILCVVLAIVLLLYAVFVFTRFTTFTGYIPFTGRIFSIDKAELTEIMIANGVDINYVTVEDDEGLSELADTLNGLRYYAWLPDLSIPRGGWSYFISLQDEAGKVYQFQFGENWVNVNRVIYFLRGDGLRELIELSSL